jgi:hypothetical protein
MSLWTEPLLEGGMVQESLDGCLLIIERRNGTAFISNLAMVLIDHSIELGR